MFGSPFAESRLKSIRAIGHLMYDDQVKQLFVKTHSNTGALSSLDRNDWLKRFECLNCSFEADRPWLSAMPRRSLRNDGANEIVCQDVRPDFLAHEFWCFAS